MKKTTIAILTIAGIFCAGQAPAQTFPELKFFNNSPDPKLSEADIVMEGDPYAEDLRYQDAGPSKAYFQTSYSAQVKGLNGFSFQSAVNLTDIKKYLAIIGGLSDSSGFAPNPSGISRALGLDLVELGENTSTSDVHMRFYGGIMDAGPVDILVRNSTVSIQNLPYRSVSGEIILPIGFTYYLTVVDALSGDTLAVFELDLQSPDEWQDMAPLVILSGFGCPLKNAGGSAVSMYAVLPGGVREFPGNVIARCETATDLIEGTEERSVRLFPNPVNDRLIIESGLGNASLLEVSDAIGNVLIRKELVPGGRNYVETVELPAGIYFYTIQGPDGTQAGKFIRMP